MTICYLDNALLALVNIIVLINERLGYSGVFLVGGWTMSSMAQSLFSYNTIVIYHVHFIILTSREQYLSSRRSSSASKIYVGGKVYCPLAR